MLRGYHILNMKDDRCAHNGERNYQRSVEIVRAMGNPPFYSSISKGFKESRYFPIDDSKTQVFRSAVRMAFSLPSSINL